MGIHSIEDLVYSPRDLNQFVTGFDASLYIEEMIQDQMKTSKIATLALAVAATLYSVQGVEDTVYGFTEHDQNIDGALSIITNDQIPYKFKYFSIRKVVYAIRSASKTGSTLFSSAWFNLMMKQSDCYDFNNQLVNDLLD